jgi:hypothetical protein
MGWTYRTDGRGEKCVHYFGWESEGKKLLGIPLCRWFYNIKVDLRVGRRGLDSSGSPCGQVAGSSEHGNEPLVSVKGGEILD